MILQPFMIGEWKKQWLGTMVSIVVIGFISIAGAFIYFVCLKRFKTMWPGMVYGVILWFSDHKRLKNHVGADL
jgi:uncharacterized membrane protein YagU involved in acid resistance